MLSCANAPDISWYEESRLFDRTLRLIGDSEECAEDALRLIDVGRGFREAEVVIDETYATRTALHNALEPHGCTRSACASPRSTWAAASAPSRSRGSTARRGERPWKTRLP